MARLFTFCVLISFLVCLTVSKSAKKNKDPEFEAFKAEVNKKKEKWSHVEEGLHAEAFDLIASGETLTFERKLDDKFECSFTYVAKPGGVPVEEWRFTMTMSPDGSAYSCQVRVERTEQTSELMFTSFVLKVKGKQLYGYSDVHRSEERKLDTSEYTVDKQALEISDVAGKFGGKMSGLFLVTAIHKDHDEL